MLNEDQIQILKEAISDQLTTLSTHHFAYLAPVIRTALFGSDSKINWDAVAEEFIKQNPEWKNRRLYEIGVRS